MLSNLQPGAVQARQGILIDGGVVGPRIDRMITIERVALGLNPQRFDLTWSGTTAAAVAAAPPRPAFA